MAYKVMFTTWAIMPDESIGNIVQGNGVIFTDKPIEDIEKTINADLKEKGKRLVCQINNIDLVPGYCL